MNILLFSALFAISAALTLPSLKSYEELFYEWMKEHGKDFSNAKDFVVKLKNFAENHDRIVAHNNKGLSYKLGHNEYSHMSQFEFRDYFRLGTTRPKNLRKKAPGGVHDEPTPDEFERLPKSVDWVKDGAVTDVKNQGMCGSCWTFSAVGALEGAYYVKYKKLVDFSEQELVSCDTTDYGCNGGFMDDAFTWVEKNGGLCTLEDYSYTSGTGSTGECLTTCTNVEEVAPKSYKDVKPESVKALMSAVAQQPVAIAIEADEFSFQFYKGGVLSGKCGKNLDHGVLLVGYGTDEDSGLDYWKVKNSWGAKWGVDGYILIEKSDDDLCGVEAQPSYPIL